MVPRLAWTTENEVTKAEAGKIMAAAGLRVESQFQKYYPREARSKYKWRYYVWRNNFDIAG